MISIVVIIVASILIAYSCVMCFFVGLNAGLKVRGQEEVQAPTPKRIFRKIREEAKQEKKQRQEEIEEQELEDYLKAIDEYGQDKVTK